MDAVMTTLFWVALLKIIWVNILLSGDNAIVIALAARNLPPDKQKTAIFVGSAGAIVLRILLTLFAVQMLQFPYLKIVGAMLLVWIGIQLLAGDSGGEDVKSGDTLFAAIRTVLIADLVMSLDNVLGVAAAAETAPENVRTLLLMIGLGLSIPLIIFGSTMLLKIMERLPVIITLGGALLGFVAGEMAVTDPAIHDWFQKNFRDFDYAVSLTCAIFVVVVGLWLSKKGKSASADKPDLSG